MYRIRWLRRAVSDRDAAITYIAEVLLNPQAAIDLGDLIDEKLDLIAKTGTLFRAGRVAGTYEYVVTPTYIVVYRLKKREKWMEIIRVLQTFRLP